MRIQFSLTVAAGKWLIASAVSSLPAVTQAFQSGRILLKGGTTVSAVCELLTGSPMMISGRVSPTGTRTAPFVSSAQHPHALLLDRGTTRPVAAADWPDVMAVMKRGDCLVTGANLIDAHGGAALMCGSPYGDGAGPWLGAAPVEGFEIIVAAGLEKLVPGRVEDLVRASGRRLVDRSYGMAVGLLPLHGRILTEIEAVTSLAKVDCWVVGRGGVHGAEGGTTLVVEGDDEQVAIVEQAYLEAREKGHSGTTESLRQECGAGSPGCRHHLACLFRKSPE